MKQVLEFEKPIVKLREEIEELQKKLAAKPSDKLAAQIADQEAKLDKLQRDTHSNLNPWQRVQISRHIARPYMLDYIKHCCDEFVEIHGDRHIGDDNAMPAGFATIGGQRVAIMGHQKGRDTKENLLRNFGSAHPEGYRKALRLMRMAEKFSLPIVTLIDTPGAFPGIGAEERNIAEAIAFNLREMMTLTVPIVAVVIGEGGSGGALGIGVANSVLMLENAYYSVISPEGCAAILWKHRQHAPEAAEALKLTASHLLDLAIVDEVIPEPAGGAHYDPETAAHSLAEAVVRHLKKLQPMTGEQLIEHRYQKFRKYGAYEQTVLPVSADS